MTTRREASLVMAMKDGTPKIQSPPPSSINGYPGFCRTRLDGLTLILKDEMKKRGRTIEIE